MEKITIGYTSNDYPNRRNILSFDSRVNFKKIYNPYMFLQKFKNSLNRFSKIAFNQNIFNLAKKMNTFDDYGLYLNVDLLHFFNLISFGKKPWISTFETVLPYYYGIFKCFVGVHPDFNRMENTRAYAAFDALASENCKAIIAISGNARDQQLNLVKNIVPKYFDAIYSKTSVLHPPQLQIIEGMQVKNYNQDIVFVFLGNLFYNKGGLETLKAFSKLYEQNKNFKLIIISSFQSQDRYIKDEEETQEILKNSPFINFMGSIPNAQVLKILKKAHVGLLPTFEETYGYSVLEFQAAGCPVITTNIGALTELNNNEIGWVIDLPINKFKRCTNIEFINGEVVLVQERQEHIRKLIIDRLYRIVSDIMNDVKIIEEKGQKCLLKIMKDHAPEDHADFLYSIYGKI